MSGYTAATDHEHFLRDFLIYRIILLVSLRLQVVMDIASRRHAVCVIAFPFLPRRTERTPLIFGGCVAVFAIALIADGTYALRWRDIESGY